MKRTMRKPALKLAVGLALLGLAGCGPVKKSIFPPLVSVQSLHLEANGRWDITLRIQNDSYTGMTFNAVSLDMTLHGHPAGHVDAQPALAIPQLSSDVTHVELQPQADAAKALAAIANKGSSASVTYRLKGSVTAVSEQDKKTPHTFKVSHKDWLSPVPGIPDTFR